MRALALMGDRAGALRVADDLARVLGTELGAGAGPETRALAERIRDARVGRRIVTTTPSAPPRPPLVGRTSQLAALATAWERARGGRGQVVVIEGDPGEGVSRLLDEFVARARLEHVTVAAARAVPGDRTMPWSALSGLLAGGLAEAPGLVGAPPAALAAVRALDTVSGASMAGAVSAVLGAAADERPVLLALDDAQWIDPDTLALLPGLARDTARKPVLIAFGIARGAPEGARFDELRARFGRDLEGAVVRVERLDDAELRALTAWALPHYGAEATERLLRRIEHDTARIPLLVVALLEAVADGLKLAPGTAAWPSPKRTLLDSLPNDLSPAVVGSICQRFRRLAEPAQQVAGAAAALAQRVDAATLVRATGLSPVAVEESLDLLEWERWLLADTRGYVFAAPIVRAVLLQEMVTPGQVRRYQKQASPTLESDLRA
jgi:predicted ATPase